MHVLEERFKVETLIQISVHINKLKNPFTIKIPDLIQVDIIDRLNLSGRLCLSIKDSYYKPNIILGG